MFSGSRTSLARVVDLVASRRTDPAFAGLAADLYAACDLLDREKALREAISDSGRTERSRGEITTQIFEGKVSALALEVLTATARQRWSSAEELLTGVRILGDNAAFMAASDNGTLDAAEDEIFRIGRVIAGSPTLQAALTDPALTTSVKTGIVTDLLAGKVTDTTALVVGFALSHLHGRRIEQAMEELVDLAAEQRTRVVAVVRVAAPLDAVLEERMAAALSTLTGRIITINVIVDPSVLGGALVTVGGEVIDGTVANRLADARRAVVG
jgi:F-type H+-transporting ATPase subunit delta